MMTNNSVEKWDFIIDSKSELFDFNLKSVWEYRGLIYLLVKRDFVAFYKQTILGPIWFFVQPIFVTITYVLIFGKLAKISTDSIPQPLFYFNILYTITILNLLSKIYC